MKFFCQILVAIVLLLGEEWPARAGTISSGGGLIFGDEINPWFLENVTEAKYCIDTDEDNFGVGLSKARELVRRALQEWQSIFAKNAWTNIYGPGELAPYGNIHLGTQNFVEESCNAHTDLRFQLGRLSQEQIKAYGIDTKSTVATTVRTTYDETTLRGKGFIYVGPHLGQLQFAAPGTIAEPWKYCDGCLLRMTLMHELGHVFGLAHTNNEGDLMGARYVDFLTQRKFVESVENEQSWTDVAKVFERTKNIFAADSNFILTRCDFPLRNEAEMVKFLGVSPETKCLRAVITDRDRLALYSSTSKEGPFKILGRTQQMTGSFHSQSSSLVHVKMNPKQQVFNVFPGTENDLFGPANREIERRNAAFVLNDGSHRVISYRMKVGNGLEISGAIEGRIFVFDATP